jgi:hypothetical protein
LGKGKRLFGIYGCCRFFNYHLFKRLQIFRYLILAALKPNFTCLLLGEDLHLKGNQEKPGLRTSPAQTAKVIKLHEEAKKGKANQGFIKKKFPFY